MKRLKQTKVKKILIRSANWVGDAVMSTPAIQSLRHSFPDAEISILTKPWTAAIFQHNPHIDNILIYNAHGRHRGIKGILRLSKDIRKQKFDMAFLIQNAFEAALISWLAAIPVRLGYDTDARKALLTHAVHRKPEYKKRHQIDYYLEILSNAGLPVNGGRLVYTVTREETRYAQEMLSRSQISGKTKWVGINPGAAFGTAKRWFPERFADVCNQLRKLDDIRVMIFGAPGEEDIGKTIREHIGKDCIDLTGKTTLRQAAALIRACDAFITNDSGLMHIAAALDVPQIALFGPTNHLTTSPASSNSTIIRHPVSCSPCMKPHCPTDHRCMKEITVAQVVESAQRLLVKGC